MKIIQTASSFLKPFHFSSPITTRNGITSLSPTSINTTPRRLLAASCSLLDDGVSGSAVKALEIDPMLAVKKKAIDISPGLKGTSIYLVGMNSTMKTRLGELLADALRYCYFDSDHLVVQAAGGEAAAKELLDVDEVGFRESETEVLRQLSSMGRLVVSAGDGAVRNSTNLSLLRHGISIWVDVPLDMVAKEIVEDGARFIGSEISSSASHSEVRSRLAMLYEELQGGYAVADATISLQKVAGQLGYDDIGTVSTGDMGLEVLSELEKLMRVKKMMEEAARPF
ncbi:probable inactive shikimate kinase like 1, chloroplastic [Cynara cardunculus var. scolymus]|uniref:Shikimate kinase n=1 Tax=Cynara cardunculus var. scolymus TaxID=59895 RepID=A0A118K5K6_CYNCS|nr:probable inactive shikimate kinase like 1, chloroplastic [Cynara cardunculus var. scolymus]KVI09258.1 Shikimate kinase [Cynara cardunculus var. scolymus]